ncbi:MAG: cytochrome c-type biogenesis protein [Novosphingobium sp.]|uniref:cytochrome c-type biogenesis protein n=1 Tax=Novosphingobium sp. TaxID=1874826 RepID=UPI003C7A1F71
MKRLLAVLALLSAAAAWSDDRMPPAPYANVQLENAGQEAMARELMETLRCVQCQGQSIADSDAQIAGDLRNQVRVRIKAGEQPEAIRAWLIERYGDYVSFEPKLNSMTWPLFAAPLVMLLFAAFVMRRRFARTRG